MEGVGVARGVGAGRGERGGEPGGPEGAAILGDELEGVGLAGAEIVEHDLLGAAIEGDAVAHLEIDFPGAGGGGEVGGLLADRARRRVRPAEELAIGEAAAVEVEVEGDLEVLLRAEGGRGDAYT